jgi:diguanylate cyclase (GGDEF)-like protein
MVIAVLPLSMWLLYQKQHVYVVLSIAVLAYLFFMLELSMRGYKQLRTTIKLRHVNEFLVKQLSGRNQDLLIEIAEREKTQEQLDYLATHDALTKIPNRLSFNLIFDKTLARAHRHSQELMILFIDVDHFKDINDNYGHDIGDIILYKVARRLKKHLRANDTIARIGGDEFIILLEDISNEDFLHKFNKRIARLFQRPIKAKQYRLPITVSVGVSSYPHDGESIDILLKKADIALYRAKGMGRNRIELYRETTQSS